VELSVRGLAVNLLLRNCVAAPLGPSILPACRRIDPPNLPLAIRIAGRDATAVRDGRRRQSVKLFGHRGEIPLMRDAIGFGAPSQVRSELPQRAVAEMHADDG